MTQFLPTLIPELPDPFNGDDLADDWNEFIAAYQTGQLGTERPVWAAKGFIWPRDNGDGTVTPMLWDGSEDHIVGLQTREIDNANTVDVNGIFNTTSSTTNLPSGIGAFGGLINVERTATDRGWQLYAPAASGSEQRLFFRTQNSGGHDDWAEVLHSSSTAWRMPFGGNGGDTSPGIQITQDGFIGATRASDLCLRLSRTTTTGKIASFRQGTTERGSIEVSAGGVTYNTTSDARLKTNLRDFDSGAIIDAMEFYHYDRTDVVADGYGAMAQDAHEVFPHCVSPGSEAGPGEEGFDAWGADYSKLVPVHGHQLRKVRERLAATEEKLAAIEAKLAALENG